MHDHAISEMLRSMLDKVRELIDADTIIGTPIQVTPDVTIVPVSQVSIGLAGGGSDFGKPPAGVKFGGGSGAGVSVKPVCFIAVENGSVRLLPCEGVAASPYAAAIDAVPGAVERLVDLVTELKNRKEKTE